METATAIENIMNVMTTAKPLHAVPVIKEHGIQSVKDFGIQTSCFEKSGCVGMSGMSSLTTVR
jgi:hypothetical protein